MKRVFVFLTVMILALTSIVHFAGAVTPNAVIQLFLSQNLPGKWEKTDIYRVEGRVNYQDYTLYVNTYNGKITEIVYRGWFDDLQRVPRLGNADLYGYTWSEGITAYFNFIYTLLDLGIFEDDNYPDGTTPLNPDDLYPRLQRGSIDDWSLNYMKESWRNIYISKGLLEATNKTGAYFLISGREHGEFEVYVKLP